jgi:capsular polysaccharide biosynthesis protein
MRDGGADLLRSGFSSLRTRRRVVAVAGLVGLALGALYAVVVPPVLGSTALILLSAGTGSGAGSLNADITTQVQIVLSTPVLQRAGNSLTPRRSASEVLDEVDVEAVTAQLLSIRASSPSSRQAEALSQAVASAYVDTLQSSLFSVTGKTIDALRAREADLDAQLKAVATRIDEIQGRARGLDPKSAAARQDAELLDRLIADQSDLALHLEKVRQELSGVQPTAPTQLARIVQPATPATGPGTVWRVVRTAFTAALIALACVAVLLLIRARYDARLRARDDLADAVGSTVLADIRGRPQRSVADWTTLFETYEASAGEAWAFRQVLRSLVGLQEGEAPGRLRGRRSRGGVEHPRSVTVISFAGDASAVSVGPQLAVFTASLGITTRLVLSTGQDSAPPLWAACSSGRVRSLRAGLILEVRTDDPVGGSNEAVMSAMHEGDAPSPAAEHHDQDSATGSGSDRNGGSTTSDLAFEFRRVGAHIDVAMTSPAAEEVAAKRHAVNNRPAADLVVVVAVVDPRKPSVTGVPATARTALAISPGKGTREDLARLAVVLDDAGRQVDGLMIADPDPSDRTTGRRPLADRARPASLPDRLTGIGDVLLAPSTRGTGGDHHG